jgi:hypothetical protein
MPILYYPTRGWNTKKADWALFERLSEEALEQVNFTESRHPNELLAAVSDCMLNAAQASIPKTSHKQRKHPVPWWN